jgi:hypothetical protein
MWRLASEYLKVRRFVAQAILFSDHCFSDHCNQGVVAFMAVTFHVEPIQNLVPQPPELHPPPVLHPPPEAAGCAAS